MNHCSDCDDWVEVFFHVNSIRRSQPLPKGIGKIRNQKSKHFTS